MYCESSANVSSVRPMSSTALTDPDTRKRLTAAAAPTAMVKASRPSKLNFWLKFLKALIIVVTYWPSNLNAERRICFPEELNLECR